MTAPFDIRYAAAALGGQVTGRGRVACLGPGHSQADRSPSVLFDPSAPEGITVHSFATDDWLACREHVKRQLGITTRYERRTPPAQAPRKLPAAAGARTAMALRWWNEAVPLLGMLGERYLIEHRHLPIRGLGNLFHALRWNGRRQCVVALMTDPVTAEPTGVHRIFLARDGSKVERKMLGPRGVIRLTADDDVTMAVGLSEGIEDGLGVMLSGWRPIWAATSAGAIEPFPVLAGIEALTIFADADSVGMKAAAACEARWHNAGRDAVTLPPPRGHQ